MAGSRAKRPSMRRRGRVARLPGMLISRPLWLVLATLAACLAASLPTCAEDRVGLEGAAVASDTKPTLRVDLGGPAYEFEGWGTSLCWWAHRVGDWPDASLDPLLEAIVDPDMGLGLSVFRYNLGGGANPTHDHFRPGGDLPGFQAGQGEPIDAEADPNQRRVLQKLLQRTERPIVEAFSNSPPYWMTRSGCVAGGHDGAPNLPDDRVDDFVAYLAEVVRLYRERHGIAFRTLDPFNEPNQSWWREGGKQEGCQVPEAQQGPVLDALAAALADRGLADVTALAATDAHSIDATLRNLQTLDDETLARVGQINTHSYRGSQRTELCEFAAGHGKRLWQSESGPMGLNARGGGVRIAMLGRVALDLNELRPAAWVMWQVIDDSPAWGCFSVDYKNRTFQPTANFRLYTPLTRSIRPGDRIVPTSDPTVVAALDSGAEHVTLIVVNERGQSERRAIQVEGVGLSEAAPIAMCGRSDSDNKRIADLVWEDSTVTFLAPTRSVTAVMLERTRARQGEAPAELAAGARHRPTEKRDTSRDR